MPNPSLATGQTLLFADEMILRTLQDGRRLRGLQLPGPGGGSTPRADAHPSGGHTALRCGPVTHSNRSSAQLPITHLAGDVPHPAVHVRAAIDASFTKGQLELLELRDREGRRLTLTARWSRQAYRLSLVDQAGHRRDSQAALANGETYDILVRYSALGGGVDVWLDGRRLPGLSGSAAHGPAMAWLQLLAGGRHLNGPASVYFEGVALHDWPAFCAVILRRGHFGPGQPHYDQLSAEALQSSICRYPTAGSWLDRDQLAARCRVCLLPGELDHAWRNVDQLEARLLVSPGNVADPNEQTSYPLDLRRERFFCDVVDVHLTDGHHVALIEARSPTTGAWITLPHALQLDALPPTTDQFSLGFGSGHDLTRGPASPWQLWRIYNVAEVRYAGPLHNANDLEHRGHDGVPSDDDYTLGELWATWSQPLVALCHRAIPFFYGDGPPPGWLKPWANWYGDGLLLEDESAPRDQTWRATVHYSSRGPVVHVQLSRRSRQPLGEPQRRWLTQLLAAHPSSLIFIYSPQPWGDVGGTRDLHAGPWRDDRDWLLETARAAGCQVYLLGGGRPGACLHGRHWQDPHTGYGRDFTATVRAELVAGSGDEQPRRPCPEWHQAGEGLQLHTDEPSATVLDYDATRDLAAVHVHRTADLLPIETSEA